MWPFKSKEEKERDRKEKELDRGLMENRREMLESYEKHGCMNLTM